MMVSIPTSAILTKVSDIDIQFMLLAHLLHRYSPSAMVAMMIVMRLTERTSTSNAERNRHSNNSLKDQLLGYKTILCIWLGLY